MSRRLLAVGLTGPIVLGSLGCVGASAPVGKSTRPVVVKRVGEAGAPVDRKPRNYLVGLDFPVDMAWEEGTKRFFYTEKATGKVRIAVGRRLLRKPCVDLDVSAEGERGALGIVLDPKFHENHWVYVYYTNASPLQNRVTRFTVKRNRCTKPKHILRGIPTTSSARHNGGQLEFMGNKLFVAVGDGYNSPGKAQDLSSRLGKILRYNRNGSVPKGNPFNSPGNRNPVWSYGHRNPFGLAFDRSTRTLYSSENGPHCDDELNRIKKGRNYGWGLGNICGTKGVGPNPIGPLYRWTPTIAPTDLVVYEGPLRSLRGRLFMGDFNHGRLHKFKLSASGKRVVKHSILFDFNRQVADVAIGPRGYLYVLTMVAIKRFVPAD